MKRLALCLVLVPSLAVAATTYYVRPDGGTASQCTGKVDAPYPGSGTNQPCAWNHPFQALPPGGSPRISGGDTLVIKVGSYKMGYGAPGAGNCDQAGSYECHMPPVPSGPDASHPTRIVGEGWAAGCGNAPELWGAERPWFIINLTDSSNVEISCLDITDHSSCIEYHNSQGLPCSGCDVPCERDNPPYGGWAPVGIYAEDSNNVYLSDLNVHGLASIGIHAGRLRDWTVERVRIYANGSAGWDGDLWDAGGDNNSGNLVFRNVEVGYNGCGEEWPAKSVNLNTCWGQEAGGYGDGFAAGASGGHWALEDCRVHHNTSDGIDFLYLRGDSTFDIRRLIAEGNAGNQLKTAGPGHVENSLLIGNCAFFDGRPLMAEGDNCRAYGGAYSIDFHRGNAIALVNSTITGQGDCLVDAGCNDSEPGDADPDCDGSERITVNNTLFNGNTDWRQPWENTCLFWYDDSRLPADPRLMDYNLVYQAKDDPCSGAHDVCAQNPLVANASLSSYDGHLQAGSPAINKGTPAGAPSDDLDQLARDAQPDIGAYEYGVVGTCTLSCSATVPSSAAPNVAVLFQAFTTPGKYCSGTAMIEWDFGDGSSLVYQVAASHSYAAEGTYNWRMTASLQGVQCIRTGSILVSASAGNPTISSITQIGTRGFRLRIRGTDFLPGIKVYIGKGSALWTKVRYVSASEIILNGGNALKAKFPRGVTVKIKVVNPGGGQATGTYKRR